MRIFDQVSFMDEEVIDIDYGTDYLITSKYIMG